MGEQHCPTDFAASKQVGSTSLSLPAFGFGAAHLGELYAKVDEADVAGDAGCRLGRRRPLLRHRALVWPRPQRAPARRVPAHQAARRIQDHHQGRPHAAPPEGPGDASIARRGSAGSISRCSWDYSYDGIMRSYEQALQRLALDTVDALVIHDLDAELSGRALRAAPEGPARLRRQGAAGAQEVRRHQGLRHGHQHRRGARRRGAAGRARFLPRRHALHAARPARACIAAWRRCRSAASR